MKQLSDLAFLRTLYSEKTQIETSFIDSKRKYVLWHAVSGSKLGKLDGYR